MSVQREFADAMAGPAWAAADHANTYQDSWSHGSGGFATETPATGSSQYNTKAGATDSSPTTELPAGFME